MSDSSPHPLESAAEEKVTGHTVEKEDNDEDPEDPLVIDEAQEKAAETGETEDGNTEEDNEKEFEPTVDMLMNEFDDEQTIEEEEALGQEDDGRVNIVNILRSLNIISRWTERLTKRARHANRGTVEALRI